MRNPNGYGTIVCLDKSGKKRRNPWGVRITVGWDGEKQKTKYIGYYKTQKEAQLALAQYHMNHINVDANKITFNELFNMWKDKQSKVLSKRNLMAYESTYKLTSILHEKKLKDIKAVHLQNVLDALDRKRASKVKLKSLWNQMYNYGLENDLLTKNYAEFVKVDVQQEDVGKIYPKEEIQWLWENLDKNPIVKYILMLIYTGMRINEFLSVKITDVHLEERYIDIHGTKTKAANRLVPIHDDIIPLISRCMHQNYLVENKPNEKYPDRTFSRHYQLFTEANNLDHVIHDTRKTFVTVLHDNGVAIEDIRFMVGHAQQGVTASVYLKSNPTVFIEKIKHVKFY